MTPAVTLQTPITLTAKVTAAGTAEVDFPSPRGTVPRILQQVSVGVIEVTGSTTPTAPGNATAGVYFNGGLITPLVPQGDAASGEPYLKVGPNDLAAVLWTNCTPGRTVTATFIYDDGL